MSGRATAPVIGSWGSRLRSTFGNRIWRSHLSLILIYLAAIVLANLSAAFLGPRWTIVNAFLLIGLDLSCRDRLHELWHRRHLAAKMLTLIAAGSAITVALNASALQIAVASTVAFAAAALVDTALFTWLWPRERLVRMNGSNLGAAAVDSLVFPTLAFGALMPAIVIGQFAAKVAGGFLWSLLLTRRGGPD